MRFCKGGVVYVWVVIAVYSGNMVSVIAQAQIAFTSNRDGNPAIYIMGEDGRLLGKFMDNAQGPTWSPDGKKIAFTGWVNSLFIKALNGEKFPSFLAPTVFYPAWSPRGDQIAGTAPHPHRRGLWRLVIVDAQSGKKETPDLDFIVGGWGSRPSWSSAGQTMAVGGYMLDAEDFTVISRPQGLSDVFHVWSPDGTQIAFQSQREEGRNWDIYIINSDGTNLRRLTTHPAWDGWPTWSGDGQSIAFASNRDGNYEIYVIDVDGQNLRNLTNHPAEDRDPAWFPATAARIDPTGKLATSWGALKRNMQ